MEGYDFDQINLVPRKCIVDSRSECDTTCTLGSRKFKLPVVPANMECVVDMKVVKKLAANGYFYILHRFYTKEEILAFCEEMQAANLYISLSVGVNEDSYDLIRSIVALKIQPDYITIDIAHGHAQKMEKMLVFLRATFSGEKRPFLIAGNVSTPQAVRDLEAWGADAIKVGIGPGSACTTYTATGFGSRGIQASTIRACSEAAVNSVIIADGGIKEAGDIAKAIALGAECVMVGGMFSGLRDSPGNEVMGLDGSAYKEFWGSASAFQSGKLRRIEGMKHLVKMKPRTYLEEMQFIQECLQSAISYGGGNKLAALRDVQIAMKKD